METVKLLISHVVRWMKLFFICLCSKTTHFHRRRIQERYSVWSRELRDSNFDKGGCISCTCASHRCKVILAWVWFTFWLSSGRNWWKWQAQSSFFSWSVQFLWVQQNGMWTYKCSGYILASDQALLTWFVHEIVLSLSWRCYYVFANTEKHI